MPPANRLAFLDFARGFAILAIVAYHCLQPVASGLAAKAIAFGGAGVHLFVFLSAFGLTLSRLQRPAGSQLASQFLGRRLRRILVPYYAFLTFIFCANQWLPLYPDGGYVEYFSHIFLFKMFDESLVGCLGYHLWFISTIVQFYLLFPTLFRCLERFRATHLVAVAGGISFVFGGWTILAGYGEHRIFTSNCLVYLWEFALGMIAAKRVHAGKLPFWQLGWKPLVAATCAAICVQTAMAMIDNAWFALLNNGVALFGFLGLTIITFRLTQQAWASSAHRWIIRSSASSYELYLTHGVVVTRGYVWVAPNGLLLQITVAALLLVLSLSVAELYHALLTACGRPVSFPKFGVARDVFLTNVSSSVDLADTANHNMHDAGRQKVPNRPPVLRHDKAGVA